MQLYQQTSFLKRLNAKYSQYRRKMRTILLCVFFSNIMLFDTISIQLKEAMKAQDSVRVLCLRSLLAACKNALVAGDKKDTLTDEECLSIIKKLVKQRKDSIEQFQAASREDLVAKEEQELKILETFLPAELSDSELAALVQEAITELNTTSKSDMGKVMGLAMKKVASRADGTRVKTIFESSLS